MNTRLNKTIALALMGALLAGCATGPQGGGSGVARQSGAPAGEAGDPCNVGGSALFGAAAGALVGALKNGGRGAVAGALAGGALGAIGCIAINSTTRQTKSAAQVEKEYVQARGRLPAEPQLVSYQPRLSSNVVQRGQPIHVSSVVELVHGSKKPITEVREELVVYDHEGKPFKTGSKPLVVNSAGRFENAFELTLPKAASQGVYAMKTNLYVNGQLTASRTLNTQLVWDGSQARLIASL